MDSPSPGARGGLTSRDLLALALISVLGAALLAALPAIGLCLLSCPVPPPLAH